MLNILLIRTGATEYDSQRRVQGTLNVPLSEAGQQQIERVATELAPQTIDALYAGPCNAAKQTGEILADRLDLKVKTLDKLANLDHGLWQGMLIEEVKAKQPKVYRQWQENPESVCPPEGETLQATRERLHQVLAKLVKKHKSGAVAVVAPEPLVSLIRNILRDEDLGNLWHAQQQNGQLWEVIAVPAEAKS